MPPKKNGKAVKNKLKASSQPKLSPSPSPGLEADDEQPELKLSHRTVTGTLSSHRDARDIKVDNVSISSHGTKLIEDSVLELSHGNRYGLIGDNGCGKSTLLEAIASREFPIPERQDIFFLDREAEASDMTAVECVLQDAEAKRARLERDAEILAADPDQAEALEDVYEQLESMDIDAARVTACEILHGLGFTHEMQNKKTRDFSGGWRMRISLARALLVRPNILLLDEPTNHLDLTSCVWLEEYLSSYKRILLMVSHSQDFLNNVCTNIIRLHDRKLMYYGGNYDAYVKTRAEKEEHQMKQYEREQDEIAHLKEYIAKYGHGSAKLAKQAQSREKVLVKMADRGLTQRVEADRVYRLKFKDPGPLPPPILTLQKVSFGYSPEKMIFKDLEVGIDLDSRVALVGPNGAGKSTLMKLMLGDNVPQDGMVKRHSHLRIGYYNQHVAERLDLNMSALQYFTKEFGDKLDGEPAIRKCLGRFGTTGVCQTVPMKNLSDGQVSRIVFAWIAENSPHILMLDEPTNHLSMDAIDGLADAINRFKGGLLLISHDFRLISQVAKEIWECRDGQVIKWPGDIVSYKAHLAKQMHKDLERQRKLMAKTVQK